jgi:hypothetical protein
VENDDSTIVWIATHFVEKVLVICEKEVSPFDTTLTYTDHGRLAIASGCTPRSKFMARLSLADIAWRRRADQMRNAEVGSGTEVQERFKA